MNLKNILPWSRILTSSLAEVSLSEYPKHFCQNLMKKTQQDHRSLSPTAFCSSPVFKSAIKNRDEKPKKGGNGEGTRIKISNQREKEPSCVWRGGGDEMKALWK